MLQLIGWNADSIILNHQSEMLLICGTSIEVIAEWEAVLAEGYEGVIQKTWLGPAQGANTGPAIAVAAVTRD